MIVIASSGATKQFAAECRPVGCFASLAMTAGPSLAMTAGPSLAMTAGPSQAMTVRP